MNHTHLNKIADRYMEQFEQINDSANDETCKWRAVAEFQKLFRLDAEDFPGMLEQCRIATGNLIDNGFQQPLRALCFYAREEPEIVRSMFKALYSEDNGDLAVRQERILTFLAETEALRERYFPDSWRYRHSQHHVMAYLFFFDPDHNYLYKAAEAKAFAVSAEYDGDWGTERDFDLKLYYRMCDEVGEYLSQLPDLLTLNQSRFEGSEKPCWPDASRHLLIWDFIYSTAHYRMLDGVGKDKLTIKARTLLQERRKKARELYNAVLHAETREELLVEANAYFKSVYSPGAAVHHKIFGDGKVTKLYSGKSCEVGIQFDGQEQEKKLRLLQTAARGLLRTDAPGYEDKLAIYKPVLKEEAVIPLALKRSREAFLPYEDELEYLF